MRFLIPLLATLLPATAATVHAQEGPEAQRVVVHLSSLTNNLHAANMALKFGALLERQGAEVTLFIDLEGARLADVRQPLNLTWGDGPSVADLLADYLAAGGEIMVCPHCAAAIGLTEAQLRKGFRIGEAATIAELMLEADKILDY
jgi:predicted peroxiredoxin